MKKILMICMLNTIYSLSVFAVECPNTPGDWTDDHLLVNFSDYGPGGEVDFQYRGNALNGFEIKMDWSSLDNNSDFMSDSILMKYFETEAVKKVCPLVKGKIYTINVYFKTACSVKVKVALKTFQTEWWDCPCLFPEINVEIEEYVGTTPHSWISKYYKKIPCGEKCCRRQYQVIIREDPGTHLLYAELWGPDTFSVSGCDNVEIYEDCLGGPNSPCEGNCE